MELVEQTLIENRLREAEIYAKQGLIDEALEVYRTLRDLVSEEEDGLKEEIQKRILELEAFRGSVSEELLSKGAEEEKFKKALTLKEGAFYQEAAKLLEELARESPRTEVYSHLADCFTALGEHEKAANCLRQALRLFPLTPENRLEYLELKKRLAEELEKAYEFEQALIVYQDLERELLGEEKEQVQEKIAFLRDLVQGASQLKFLFKEKVLTPSVCKEALEIAKEEGASIESVLIEKFGISKELIGQALSRFYNCPFWEFKEGLLLKKPDCLEGVKETFLKQLLVAPLLREDGGLALVISNPFDINALEQAKKILKIKDFELLVALREDILKLLDYYYGLQQYPETAPLLEILPEEETVEEEEEGIPEDQESVVVQFANYLLEEAYNRGASDIHIESLTGRRGAQIRFRIDGECIPFQTVPYQMKRPLISRYKIMAGLDIAEKRLPQDGKIKFRTRTGKVFEVRVATIPTIENNEDIVMRILGGV
ncbi:MAG: type II/IV secretion system protein, partial [Thermodesulfatator sp.]